MFASFLTWPAKGWPILRIRALHKNVNLWPTTVMINYTFSAKTNIMILPPIIGDKYLEAVNIINLTLSSTSWNHKHCHRYHCSKKGFSITFFHWLTLQIFFLWNLSSFNHIGQTNSEQKFRTNFGPLTKYELKWWSYTEESALWSIITRDVRSEFFERSSRWV